MLDVFVKPEDTITVRFAVAVDNEGKMYADAIKEDLSKMLEGSEFTIEEHSVTFKRPDFGDTVKLSQGISSDGVNVTLNLLPQRYQRMIKLIKSWTLKDKEGKILESNEKNISSLNPIVASVILDQLDIEMGNIFA